MATSVMWSPNVADFAKSYRVYAVDIMGQPTGSRSAESDSFRDVESGIVMRIRIAAVGEAQRGHRRYAGRAPQQERAILRREHQAAPAV